jgi:hypothetical protein
MLSNASDFHLGIQTDVTLPAIPANPIPGQVHCLTSEALLGDKKTTFTFKKDGSFAAPGSDYSIDEAGILSFLERGEYQIFMQNEAVRSITTARNSENDITRGHCRV